MSIHRNTYILEPVLNNFALSLASMIQRTIQDMSLQSCWYLLGKFYSIRYFINSSKAPLFLIISLENQGNRNSKNFLTQNKHVVYK